METRIKNHFLLSVLVACICFIQAESARAQSGNYNGFGWEKSGNAVTITGYSGSGGVVTIPGTIPYGSTNLPVTSIGNEAFSFSQLTSVTVPDDVTNIGFEAFFWCDSLTNVVLGSGVNNIGSSAFAYCEKLAAINFPNGLANIGASVFGACASLTSISIPDSVTNIGGSAFAGCTSMTNVTIGRGVISLGDEAFSPCPELPAFTVDPENSFYCSLGGVLFNKNQTTLIQFPGGAPGNYYAIPDTVTNIGDWAFAGCTNLASVTIPDGVISINTNAFFYCISLTSISIPDSVTSIGFEAFLQTGLTNVTIPDSVTSIGASAFAMSTPGYVLSTGLASVTIGSTVTNIGEDAFWNCANLQSIYFRGDAPAGDSTVFGGDTDVRAYYLPGTTNWSVFSAETGIPATLWLPQIQTGASSFGVETNQFEFNINWASGQTVTVEVCTNVSNPDWQPLQTNTLTGSSQYFSDPQATNYPARFYRIISP